MQSENGGRIAALHTDIVNVKIQHLDMLLIKRVLEYEILIHAVV